VSGFLGGILPQKICESCNKKGILMIMDEVEGLILQCYHCKKKTPIKEKPKDLLPDE